VPLKDLIVALVVSVFPALIELEGSFRIHKNPPLVSLLSQIKPSAIAGFCRGVNETFALLGCYVALIGSYRRFGTDHLS
jgi:hypothetical protein